MAKSRKQIRRETRDKKAASKFFRTLAIISVVIIGLLYLMFMNS